VGDDTGARPLIEAGAESVVVAADPDALMAGHRPRHKEKAEAGLEAEAPMARAARL
jgi:hypothetical protein